MRQYKHLTEADRKQFLEQGWIRVPNAMNKEIMDEWLSNMWVRLGMDPNDKTTWKPDYVTMPGHREVRIEELCPDAYNKICELVGGEERLHPERERWFSDSLKVNFGKQELVGKPFDSAMLGGVHCDADFYRQFLDSGECILTVICAFTDSDTEGGATAIFPHGIKQVCETWYNTPQGSDSPHTDMPLSPFRGLKDTTPQFMEVKAGDVVITHDLLPHAASKNRRFFPKVIINPHICLDEPLKLYREDGDYAPVEQFILHHLGREEGLPEFKITRPRLQFYPRQGFPRRARVQDELDRMIAVAKAQGKSEESVGSLYQEGPERVAEHERRQGYDLPWGPNGVSFIPNDKQTKLDVPWGTQIFSYRDTPFAHLAKPNVDPLTLLRPATVA